MKLAERLWGNEYEVIVATHCNTNHYHNHLILNPVSLIDGHKFFNSPADYQAMRRESDRLCLEYRLSVIEDPKGRGQNYEEYSAERNGRPTNRSLIRDDIDRAVKASMTEREFFRILEEMGYTLKLYGENGRPLKYPALRPTGAKGFFRFHKLAESGYSMEDIQQRIAVNYHRKNPFPDAEQEKANEYRTQTRPKTKATGLHALYIRYCYELHIITRYPTSVKRVSFFMREDLKCLEKLDEQTRFLADNGIETIVADINTNLIWKAGAGTFPADYLKPGFMRSDLFCLFSILTEQITILGDGTGFLKTGKYIKLIHLAQLLSDSVSIKL